VVVLPFVIAMRMLMFTREHGETPT
jgi:hypothetical protein